MRVCKLSAFVGTIALCGCSCPPALPPSAPPAASAPDPVEALHRSAIVVDTHNDVTMRLVAEGVNLASRLPDGHTDIPRMREGGLDAEFLSVFVPPMLYPGERAYAQSLVAFDAIDALVAANAPSVMLARSAGEVRQAAAGGKIAFLIGVEGGPLARRRHGRRVARSAQGLLRPWRPLHDPDVVELEPARRQLGRRWQEPRTDAARPARRGRHERPRHDGRHLARLGRDLLRRGPRLQAARPRVALVGPSAVRTCRGT